MSKENDRFDELWDRHGLLFMKVFIALIFLLFFVLKGC